MSVDCTCADPKPTGWPLVHRHNCPVVRLSLRRAWFKVEHGSDQYCPCDKCLDNTTCEYAWDSYNTDDDCLATK